MSRKSNASKRKTDDGYGPIKEFKIRQDPLKEQLRDMDERRAEKKRAKKEGFSRRDVDWQEVVSVASQHNPKRFQVGRTDNVDALNSDRANSGYNKEFSVPIGALGTNPGNLTVSKKEKKLLAAYREATGREPPLKHGRRDHDDSRYDPSWQNVDRRDSRDRSRNHDSDYEPDSMSQRRGNVSRQRENFRPDAGYGFNAPPYEPPFAPKVIPKKPDGVPFTWKPVAFR